MHLAHPDGTRLGASLVPGLGNGWVVIAGATGVHHAFYRKLSEWLSDRYGVAVLSFDYRGIGSSAPRSLRGYEASYRDWASDLETAVNYAAGRGPTVVVGHSFGGHAFGMTGAHRRTRGLYTFATGAGWAGHLSRVEGTRLRLLWNFVAPPLVALKGYLPMSLLGMGEDIPLGVYRNWRDWCRNPGYFFDDPQAEFAANFDEVDTPVVAVNSVDDAWAPPRSAAAFVDHYPHVTRITVRPQDYGIRRIGHFDYVRPSSMPLWTPLGDWIEERLESAA